MRKKINLPKLPPNIGKRIKSIRTSLNISQIRFAEMLRCSNSYLSDIEKGRTKPALQLLVSISENTECDLNWLITGKGDIYKEVNGVGLIIADRKSPYNALKQIKLRPVPILNSVPAGFPETPFEDQVTNYVNIPAKFKDPEAFALIVEGNSMSPTINDGDIVIISPATPVETGQIGAFRINGDVIIKKLFKKGHTVYLLPENDQYSPRQLKKGDQLDSIGRAVYQLKKI